MSKNPFLKCVALVTLLGFTAGCASSTVIKSNPTGAKVFLNGEPVGKTPYTMTDTKIVFTTTAIRLEKPGYEPINTTITRSEEFDIAPFCGGFLTFIPVTWLWSFKYRPEHMYELERKAGGGGGGTTTPDTM
jgi:hypothetical protein